jgi:CBS domain-containing protein
MQAKELMTTDVISVGPDMPVTEIARRLMKYRISAVPVVDSTGESIGFVSEGDLLGRNTTNPQDLSDWWLTLLAEGETLQPDFIASTHRPERRARDVMSKPVVTVEEATDASSVAHILLTHHIKRVPVLRDGRIVGIVSRADLLRALAAETSVPVKAERPSYLSGALAGLDQHFLHPSRSNTGIRTASAPNQPDDAEEPTQTAFQTLARNFFNVQSERHDVAQRAVLEHDRQHVKELMDHHVVASSWHSLLQDARKAAENGEKQCMLLRFPSALCSDGGRAINAPLPAWPESLRGEAAEIYRLWERDLKPKGFHIGACVLEFPNGFPGDIGLFLKWDE